VKESVIYPLIVFATVISCTLLVHCYVKDEKQEEIVEEPKEVVSNEPADIIKTARIHPESAYSSNRLEVKYEIDRRSTLPEFRYTWRRNGFIIPGENKNVLVSDYFIKGDEISVEIELADSPLVKETFRPPAVRILNTPPRIMEAVLTMETRGAPGIFINAKSQDADGDRIRYFYTWYRNGARLEGQTGARLDPTLVMRGDRIYSEIVASDGENMSTSFRTGIFDLQNHAPRIISSPPSSTLKDRFIYQVRCEDKDSDEISCVLLSAPQGMTIDSDGRIEWLVPRGEGREEVYSVKIKASDKYGGHSIQDFTFSIATLEARQ